MRYPVEQKGETHERIVDAAARSFRELGFDGQGVAQLMKDLGLTHGGFYRHFESKSAVLVALFDRVIDERWLTANGVVGFSADGGLGVGVGVSSQSRGGRGAREGRREEVARSGAPWSPTAPGRAASRRAACADIDTWSSWFAQVGIESTLAG